MELEWTKSNSPMVQWSTSPLVQKANTVYDNTPNTVVVYNRLRQLSQKKSLVLQKRKIRKISSKVFRKRPGYPENVRNIAKTSDSKCRHAFRMLLHLKIT